MKFIICLFYSLVFLVANSVCAQSVDFGAPCMRYNTIQLTRAMINTIGLEKTIQYVHDNARLVIKVVLDSQGVVEEASVLRCDTLIDECDVDALLVQLNQGGYIFKRCYYLDFEKDKNTILNLAKQEAGPFIAYIGLKWDFSQHCFKQNNDVENLKIFVLRMINSCDSICGQ